MPKMKADFPAGSGINVAGRQSAHLTGESISVKDFSAGFGGNSSLKLNSSFLRRWRFQKILTRLQVGPVIVCENGPTVLIPQFTGSPAKLCFSA